MEQDLEQERATVPGEVNLKEVLLFEGVLQVKGLEQLLEVWSLSKRNVFGDLCAVEAKVEVGGGDLL